MFQVVHCQYHDGGTEEQLHVTHEVPSLAQAVATSGDVSYVQYCVPPRILASTSDTQSVPCIWALCHKILCQGYVETNDKGQWYSESEKGPKYNLFMCNVFLSPLPDIPQNIKHD